MPEDTLSSRLHARGQPFLSGNDTTGHHLGGGACAENETRTPDRGTEEKDGEDTDSWLHLSCSICKLYSVYRT